MHEGSLTNGIAGARGAAQGQDQARAQGFPQAPETSRRALPQLERFSSTRKFGSKFCREILQRHPRFGPERQEISAATSIIFKWLAGQSPLAEWANVGRWVGRLCKRAGLKKFSMAQTAQ